MSESFRQHAIEFLTAIDPNGCYSDADCDMEGIPRLSVDAAVEIVSRWAIDEIGADINTGDVPETVATFAEMHDHVDANKYGGAFDWPALVGDVDDPAYVQAHCDFWNAVQSRCDAWLRAGRPESI